MDDSFVISYRRGRRVVRGPLDDNWAVEYTMAMQGGGPVVEKICVSPRDGTPLPPGGLPGRVLRKVRIDAAFDAIRQVAGFFIEAGGSRPSKTYEHEAGVLTALLGQELEDAVEAAPRRPGRAGRGNEFYAEIAAAYDRLVDGGSRTPVKDLAGWLKGRGEWFTPGSVSQLIFTARERGLLTDSPPGRPGGSLTPKARALLGKESIPKPRKRALQAKKPTARSKTAKPATKRKKGTKG